MHGSVFDHLGNDKLNARSFFAQARTPYRQNEGGFTLGGPVVIPHVYNGRNKTFFFGSLGLFYSRQGAAGLLATVPTQAMLSGNFSGLDDRQRRDHSHLRPELHPAGRQWQLRANAVPREHHSRQPDHSNGEDRLLLHPGAEHCPGQLNNFYDHRASTWPYYNTTVPLIKIDHSISDKQKLMLS